jgi:tetratricopeptide (TPR) repeat protein
MNEEPEAKNSPVKSIQEWVSVIFTVIAGIPILIEWIKGITGIITYVSLGLLWGALLYCYVKKKYPPIIKQPSHLKWIHQITLIGIILIPAISITNFVVDKYYQSLPPEKVIILVADFAGPKPEEYAVTNAVLNNLRHALKSYDDVQIEALGRVITEGEGSAVARAEGDKRKATITIWGWYGTPGVAVPLSVNFEVLRPPQYLPEFGQEAQGYIRKVAIAELESFTLQTQLSAEMAYLSLFTVGVARYAVEDWNGAIDRYTAALKQIDKNESLPTLNQAIVHFYRGLAYGSKGEYNRAVSDFDRAILLQLDNALFYFNRGTAHLLNSNLDEAIADFNQSVQIRSDDARVYLNRGTAYDNKGYSDKAIDDFSRAIEIQPNLVVAYVARGSLYGDQGDYALAITDFNQATELQGDDATAYYNRGLTYLKRGIDYGFEDDINRAITDFDRATQIQPDLVYAYNNRGFIYLIHKGNPDRAIVDFNRAIQIQPDHITAYLNRGLAYMRKDQNDKAIADFDRVIQLQPDYISAYLNRGAVYEAEDQYELAIEDYSRAIDLQPDDARAYYNRGHAYMQNKEKAKAIADFRTVLGLPTASADVREAAAKWLYTLSFE